MAEAAPNTPATSWPLARGEHPDLPRLRIDIHQGHPGYQVTKKKTSAGAPPYAYVLFTPGVPLATGNPDRLRAAAADLLAAADALEAEHRAYADQLGQLPLDEAR